MYIVTTSVSDQGRTVWEDIEEYEIFEVNDEWFLSIQTQRAAAYIKIDALDAIYFELDDDETWDDWNTYGEWLN